MQSDLRTDVIATAIVVIIMMIVIVIVSVIIIIIIINTITIIIIITVVTVILIIVIIQSSLILLVLYIRETDVYIYISGWIFQKVLAEIVQKGLILSQKALISNRRNLGLFAPKSMRFPSKDNC